MSVSEKDKEIARIGSGHEGFSTTPDIHWVKKGVTSVVAPPNVASVDQLGTGATTTALIENRPVWTLKGRIDSGDLPSGPGHAGTDGGIISGRYRGICLAVTGSPQTMFESSPAVRTDDFTVQDCDGTPLPNCAGRVIRKGDEQALAAAAKYVDSLCRLERLEGLDASHSRPFGVSKGQKMPASGLGNYIEVLAGDTVTITASRITKASGMTPTCPQGRHPPTPFIVHVDDPYDETFKGPTVHGDVLVLGPYDCLAIPRVTVDLNNMGRDASHGYIRMGGSFQAFEDSTFLNADLDQALDLDNTLLKNAATLENIYQMFKWARFPRIVTVSASACAGTQTATVVVYPSGSFTIDVLALYAGIKATIKAIRELPDSIRNFFGVKGGDGAKAEGAKEEGAKEVAPRTQKPTRKQRREAERQERKNAAREAKKAPPAPVAPAKTFNFGGPFEGGWKPPKSRKPALYLAFEYVELTQAGIDGAIALQEAQSPAAESPAAGEGEDPAGADPASTTPEGAERSGDPQRDRIADELDHWQKSVDAIDPENPSVMDDYCRDQLERAKERIQRYDDALEAQFNNYQEMLQQARDHLANLERDKEKAAELEAWLASSYPEEYKQFLDAIANGHPDFSALPQRLGWTYSYIDWQWLYEVHCFQDERIEDAQKQIDYMTDVVLRFGSEYGLDPITVPGECSIDLHDVDWLRSLNPALCSLDCSLLAMLEPLADLKFVKDIPLLTLAGPLGVGSIVEEICRWVGLDVGVGLYFRVEFQFVVNVTAGARFDAYGRISVSANAQMSMYLFIGFALKFLKSSLVFKGGIRGRAKIGFPTRKELLRGRRDPTGSALFTILFHGNLMWGGEITVENTWLGFESTARVDKWWPWWSGDYPLSVNLQ